MQALSGTGSCRMALDFFARFKGKDAVVWVPDPTWPNHNNMIKDAGMQGQDLTGTTDPATRGLAFGPFMDDLKAMPDGQIILFHSCAHNPTGVDPSPKQWSEIADSLRQKEPSCFHGHCRTKVFASGNADVDGFSVPNMTLQEGRQHVLAPSPLPRTLAFTESVSEKPFRLFAPTRMKKDRVESQPKILIRPMYSNPLTHGARIVEKILVAPPNRYSLWKDECKGMADRIIEMRKLLRKTVEANHKSKWAHITDQDWNVYRRFDRPSVRINDQGSPHLHDKEWARVHGWCLSWECGIHRQGHGGSFPVVDFIRFPVKSNLSTFIPPQTQPIAVIIF